MPTHSLLTRFKSKGTIITLEISKKDEQHHLYPFSVQLATKEDLLSALLLQSAFTEAMLYLGALSEAALWRYLVCIRRSFVSHFDIGQQGDIYEASALNLHDQKHPKAARFTCMTLSIIYTKYLWRMVNHGLWMPLRHSTSIVSLSLAGVITGKNAVQTSPKSGDLAIFDRILSIFAIHLLLKPWSKP